MLFFVVREYHQVVTASCLIAAHHAVSTESLCALSRKICGSRYGGRRARGAAMSI